MLKKTSTRIETKSWIVYCFHYCRLNRNRNIRTNREAQSIENLVKCRNLNLITIRQLNAIVTTRLTRKRSFLFFFHFSHRLLDLFAISYRNFNLYCLILRKLLLTIYWQLHLTDCHYRKDWWLFARQRRSLSRQTERHD